MEAGDTCPMSMPGAKPQALSIPYVPLKKLGTGITTDVLQAATPVEAMLLYTPQPALMRVVNDCKLLCLAYEPSPRPEAMYPYSWVLARGLGAASDPYSYSLVTKGAAGSPPVAEAIHYDLDRRRWILHLEEAGGPAGDPTTDSTDTGSEEEEDDDGDDEGTSRAGRAGRATTTTARRPPPKDPTTMVFRGLQGLVARHLRALLSASGERAFVPPIVVSEWIQHPKFGSRSPQDMAPKNEALFAALATPSAKRRVVLQPAPFAHAGAQHLALVAVYGPAGDASAARTPCVYMVLFNEASGTWALFDPSPTAAWARMSQCLDVLLGTLVMDV